MRAFVLAPVLVVSACSERPDWPEPEPSASTCVYQLIDAEDEYLSRSTVYFDERGRVTRIDGFWYDDAPSLLRTAFYFEHDEQDRLLQIRWNDEQTTLEYGDEDVVVRSLRSGKVRATSRYQLVNGRVTLHQSPVRPDGTSSTTAYEYDAAGHVSRVVSDLQDWRFAYDEQGRMATATRAPSTEATVLIAYEERDGLLVVQSHDDSFGIETHQLRATIHHDGQRIGRIVYEGGGITEALDYAYRPDVIEQAYTRDDGVTSVMTATGTCPEPAVELAYPEPVPMRADATRLKHSRRNLWNWHENGYVYTIPGVVQ